MTNRKQPQAGEWWQYNGVRIYIVGVKLNGHVVCEYRDGSIATLVVGDWWQHLSDCDSFEWKPEVWPKWLISSEIVLSMRDTKQIAFVRRDNELRGETFHVDGTSFTFSDFTNDPRFKEVTEAEALAMVKPAEVIPDPGEGWEIIPYGTTLEHGDQFQSVGGQWLPTANEGRTALPGWQYRRKIKPVEDHIKPQRGMTAIWTPSYGKPQLTVEITRNDHGRVYCVTQDGVTHGDYECCFEVVEPPLPSPKRVPVRLWCIEKLVETDCWSSVFMSRDRPPGQYQEIHSDGNGGWYVEVQS